MSKKKKFKPGDFVKDALSGRKCMVLGKAAELKKAYTIRVYVPEHSNWYTMDVPTKSMEKFKSEEQNKIGFKR